MTDLMSPAVLSSQKEAMPAGSAKDPARSSPMGGKVFEKTLRQILSQDGEKNAEKTVNSASSDDETGKKTSPGTDHGNGALSLVYLGYMDLDTAGQLDLDAAVKVDVSPGESAKGILWAFREVLGAENGIPAAFQDGLPLDPGAEEDRLSGASTPLQEVDAAAVIAEPPFHGATAVSSVSAPDTQGVDLAGRNMGRNPIPGGLGENPLGDGASLSGRGAVINAVLTQPDNEPADPVSGHVLQRTRPGLGGLRGSRRAARTALNNEGTAPQAEMHGEVLADSLRSGALASQNPAVSPYMKEALAGEGAVPEGMDLVGEVLAMAQSPGNTVETTPGGFRVRYILENGTESLSTSETKAATAAVEDAVHVPNPEIENPVSPQGAGEYPEAVLDELMDQVGHPAQGSAAAFMPEHGDLRGYEAVVESTVEHIAPIEVNGATQDAKNSTVKSRGTTISYRGVGTLENAPASPADPLASAESLSGMSPEAEGEPAFQDNISPGSEMEVDSWEAESKGDSSQRTNGQELQETGRLGSLGEQVSQTGASIDVGTEQPVQGAGLKPQHPAPGTPVNPRRVVEQIVRGVELNVKGENGEIRLQLKPDSLGEVEVRIATNNGIVSAEFIAESQRVKSLIEAGLPQLKQQLMDQGLNIQGLSVQVGGGNTYGRDPYPRGAETDVPGTWRQSGSRLVQGAAGGTQARQYRWGSTIDYRV